jgi:hypothetical protein
MSYTAIIQAGFGLFRCKRLADDSSALQLAPHLNCDSDEIYRARIVAIVVLVFWGMGFPIFFGFLVKQTYNLPGFSLSLISYGYKPRFCHWEAFECLKRFVVLLVITVLEPESAAFALIVILFCSSIVTAKLHPFSNTLVNAAHLGVEVVLVVVLLVGLVSSLKSSGAGIMLSQLSHLAIVSILFMLLFMCLVLLVEATADLRPGSKAHAFWLLFLSGADAVIQPATKLGSRLTQPVTILGRRVSTRLGILASSAFAEPIESFRRSSRTLEASDPRTWLPLPWTQTSHIEQPRTCPQSPSQSPHRAPGTPSMALRLRITFAGAILSDGAASTIKYYQPTKHRAIRLSGPEPSDLPGAYEHRKHEFCPARLPDETLLLETRGAFSTIRDAQTAHGCP